MSATIKDVAREAGVASGTISKYLNGGSVRPENKKNIEEAIRRLEYRPNSLARGLRNSRSYRIAFLLPGLEGAHSAKLVAALEKYVWEMGCLLTIYCHRESPQLVREYLKVMAKQSIDGLIVIPPCTKEEWLENKEKLRIPMVVLEDTCGIPKTDVVQTDCASASYELVEYLIQKGHRKIGMIKGSMYSTTAKERFHGFQRVMEDYELPIEENYVVDGAYDYVSGYDGIRKLWQLSDPPTAVFVANYHMSVGALVAVNQFRIRIPEQLSLAAFDDMELSSIVQPGMTAIRQPLDEMMREACQILKRRIAGDYSDFPKRVRLKAQMICRDSVRTIY